MGSKPSLFQVVQNILAIVGGIATLFSCIIAFLALVYPQNAVEFIIHLYSLASPTPIAVVVRNSTPLSSADSLYLTTTPTQSPTPAPIYIPQSTATPIPTPSPTPTPTPIPDTSPGSVLEVGQTWRQDGLELQLTEASLGFEPFTGGTGFYLTFRLTNRKPYAITIRYNLGENIFAEDNLGRKLTMAPICANPYSEIQTLTSIFQSGETQGLKSRNDCFPPSVFIFVDTADISVTEVIIELNIYTIQGAKWRIPVHH